jgi:hypothetical protein
MNTSMKIFGSMMAPMIAAAALWATSAQAAQVFRAHYEIRVASNGSDNKVRSTFETQPGQPFTLDLPPNRVAMSVKLLNDEQYELRVTVTPFKPSKPQQAQAVFNRTYQGILGRPLELTSSADAIKVDGAISVVVLGK